MQLRFTERVVAGSSLPRGVGKQAAVRRGGQQAGPRCGMEQLSILLRPLVPCLRRSSRSSACSSTIITIAGTRSSKIAQRRVPALACMGWHPLRWHPIATAAVFGPRIQRPSQWTLPIQTEGFHLEDEMSDDKRKGKKAD